MSIDINLSDSIDSSDRAGAMLPAGEKPFKIIIDTGVRLGGDARAVVLPKGATGPRLEARFVDRDGEAVSLAGATASVRARSIATGDLLFERDAAIEGSTVILEWAPSDSKRPGTFGLFLDVTWGDFTRETFPHGRLDLVVEGDTPLPY